MHKRRQAVKHLCWYLSSFLSSSFFPVRHDQRARPGALTNRSVFWQVGAEARRAPTTPGRRRRARVDRAAGCRAPAGDRAVRPEVAASPARLFEPRQADHSAEYPPAALQDHLRANRSKAPSSAEVLAPARSEQKHRLRSFDADHEGTSALMAYAPSAARPHLSRPGFPNEGRRHFRARCTSKAATRRRGIGVAYEIDSPHAPFVLAVLDLLPAPSVFERVHLLRARGQAAGPGVRRAATDGLGAAARAGNPAPRAMGAVPPGVRSDELRRRRPSRPPRERSPCSSAASEFEPAARRTAFSRCWRGPARSPG